MRQRKLLQARITAGRFTLPVVIFISILCWMGTSFLLPGLSANESDYSFWNRVVSWGIPGWSSRAVSFVLYALIGYFLIELNNTFAIIRMRASVQTSLYFLLVTACPAMHLLYAGDVAAVAFVLSLYFLFKSYQQSQPSGNVFHSFVFLGAGSLLFPQMLYFIPVWLIGSYNFKSLTPRSFCAALLGLSVPYWFLLGHAIFHKEMDLFYEPFNELATFKPIDLLNGFEPWELVTLAYLFVLFIISTIHCIAAGYEDKIQTRGYLHFLIFLSFCIFLFIVVQPAYSMNLMSLLFITASILIAHLFVLTGNKLSNWFFICAMISLILLFVFNTWSLL